ncbi:hypothetical protein DFJ74DRAFT_660177 [Hyaloraphidium curvatum]|nr:hypothetical protein DFJ74DRAFT_660177 [Hyaloraphidium curvatum]
MPTAFIAVALMLIRALGGATAQTATSSPGPSPSPGTAGPLNLSSLVDQYVISGPLSGFGGTFDSWRLTRIFPGGTPEELRVDEAIQSTAGPGYSTFSATLRKLNETSLTGIFAGSSLISANFTPVSDTSNGTILFNSYVGNITGLGSFAGVGTSYPVRHALTFVEGAGVQSNDMGGAITRAELNTSFIIRGAAGQFGSYTGWTWMSTDPKDGCQDNTSVMLRMNLQVLASFLPFPRSLIHPRPRPHTCAGRLFHGHPRLPHLPGQRPPDR